MTTAEVRRSSTTEGAPGAARQGGRARAGRATGARAARSRRAPEDVRARGRRALRLRPRRVAARPDRAPVRVRRRASTTSGSRRATSRTTSTASSATMHEFGHGLYEHQVDPALERTPLAPRRLARPARVAEPHVGEPRRPLAAVLAPLLPAPAGARSRALARRRRRVLVPRGERVEPSLIRVEADEATYNLHIILRFELEQEMLADDVPARAAARGVEQRMWDYLGIEVPNDTHGVLQDMHWAGGSIGYFPTYALGNLISAQIWEQMLGRPAGPRRASSSRASSARCATGCASTCTATAASSRRARRSSASSARRDRPRAVRALPAREAPAGRSTASPRQPTGVGSSRRMAKTRVGINGFGRIGRNFFRAQLERRATSRSSRSTTSAT